ncbi:MAG: cytochrome c [Gammaproteobacteria bacterium]|nr:cytochrome c [Gammaproteobacteria bacterium]
MKYINISTAVLVVSIFSSTVFAEEEPKNLKEVMQRIEVNMSKIVGHIMREEFSDIAIAAEKVAVHDEPPLSHRLKMIAELKTDFPDFKSHDDDVHLNSVAMQEAAEKKDLKSIIESYGKTLQSCNNCHTKYRKRIQKLKF